MYINSSKKSYVSMIVQSMISPCDSIESLDDIFLVMVFFKISELSFLLFPYPALQYIRSSVWHMSRCQRTWFQFVFYRPWLVVVFMCRCGPNLKPNWNALNLFTSLHIVTTILVIQAGHPNLQQTLILITGSKWW